VLAPWRRPYKTRDGYLCTLVYTDVQWRRFWAEVGRAELADDPRFVTLATRSDNIEELYRLAGECIATRTTADWMEAMARLDIPAAPIAALEDLPDDPHLATVGFFRHAQHPSEGGIVMPDIPTRFERTAAEIARLQPRLGEHSVEILREAGLSDVEIGKLIAARASCDGRGRDTNG
jgi:crotonobetainyl-CoA:carnitine CoA-transferase CaiB-like acyl-CoA transferase